MRENTPPRVPEIDDDDYEEVQLMDDAPPDDEDELEEIQLEELEQRLGIVDGEEGEMEEEPVEDNSILTFTSHSSAVFGCDLHPGQKLAVTGGEDDKVFLWSTENGQVLQRLTQHNDTLTDVHFNHDGTYLATGDMAGEIFVFKVLPTAGNQPGNHIPLQQVWQYSMGDMVWLRWHHAANVLFAGGDTGEIFVFRIPNGDVKILTGEGERCEAGAISHDGKKLFVSYSSGKIKLWDIKTCKALWTVDENNPICHKSTVTGVACDKDYPMYVSGGFDGHVIFCSNNGPVGSAQATGAVECVAFSPSTDLKLVATGTLPGQIAVWDCSKYTLRTLCESADTEEGITKLEWLNEHTLVASTLNGNIYGYDARTGSKIFKLSGHLAEVYDFKYKASENIILSASEDNTAKIYLVEDQSL
ncbi:angio-associated migratory cell protein-like [Teleopsis dalmanni]|uniref:angio-associated migratory cell protein-like n=1 Tax=Teleopsis dalmanni TaxID=139649 RepID=UPI0018CE518D|nr:angio-associated migratory cell protein-like [Teleopsis dalmanni]